MGCCLSANQQPKKKKEKKYETNVNLTNDENELKPGDFESEPCEPKPPADL